MKSPSYSKLAILALILLVTGTQLTSQSELQAEPELVLLKPRELDSNMTHQGSIREISGHRSLTYAEKYSRHDNDNKIFRDVQFPLIYAEAQSPQTHEPHYGHSANRSPRRPRALTYAEKYNRYYKGNGIFSNVQLPWPFSTTKSSDGHVPHKWQRSNQLPRRHWPLTYADKYNWYYHGNGVFSKVHFPWTHNAVSAPDSNYQFQSSNTAIRIPHRKAKKAPGKKKKFKDRVEMFTLKYVLAQ